MEEHVEIYDYSDILHMHCRSCYKSGCTEQENCLMIRCLYCSVFLHSCKIDDHETICLMVQVSCPNVLNGCSSKMQKNEMAKHLETCPANVIHCGMEWNRYPLYSRERYTLTNIYNSQEGRIVQAHEHWVPFSFINPPKIKGQLDVELAISDQRKLIKERWKQMEIGKWKAAKRPKTGRISQDRLDRFADLIGPKIPIDQCLENCGDFVKSERDLLPIEKLSIEDCDKDRALSAEQSIAENGEIITEESRGETVAEQNHEKVQNHFVKTEVPSKAKIMQLELDKKELINYNLREHKLPENEEMVSKVPHKAEVNDAFSRKGSGSYPGSQEEEPEVAYREEKELIYSVYVQQEDFHNEKEAVLICNMAKRAPQIPAHLHEQLNNSLTNELGLNVIIETIPKFQKNYPMYSIPCNVDLRRDQYCSHFKNVHDDIHGGLNYWIQQRCPLAQYGCPFIRRRFSPGSKGGRLVFDHEIDNFGVIPEKAQINLTLKHETDFHLLSLPLELIERIAFYLDSFSINQFSKVCRTTHELCRNMLHRRGIVVLEWERGYYSDGSVLWKVRRKRWLFTPAFSHVSSWHFTDEPSMGEHLKNCPFFNRLSRSQRARVVMGDLNNIKLKSDWR